jgi:hypothetical protein
MRTVWSIISVLAVANLLALLGLAGWLKASDRLDVSRMRRLRQVFVTTLTQEAQSRKDEEAAAAAAQTLANEKAKEGTPPVAAADILNVRREETELEVQRRLRLQREINDLRRTLQTERAKLERDVDGFRRQKEAWERERAEILATARDEQFQKTLTTYEQLKPDKTKLALKQLLDAGDVSGVVSYLDGMQDRTRTKVIDEFIKDDPKLAADLLERLRARGVEPRGAEGAP